MFEKLGSWLETREIRADPDLMESFCTGIADMRDGRLIPLEDVAKELGIDLPSVQDATSE